MEKGAGCKMKFEEIAQLKMIVEEILDQLETNQDTITRVWSLLAKNLSVYRDKLVENGFTREEALFLLKGLSASSLMKKG